MQVINLAVFLFNVENLGYFLRYQTPFLPYGFGNIFFDFSLPTELPPQVIWFCGEGETRTHDPLITSQMLSIDICCMFPFEQAYGIEPLFPSDKGCANHYTKAAFSF